YAGQNFDPRVVALTHASQKLLERIDCWEAIRSERVCAYRDMIVWDGEGTAEINFSSSEVRTTHLGHIVENSLAVRSLREQMQKYPQIHLLQPVTVVAMDKPDAARKSVQIQLNNGSEVFTFLL